MRRVLLLCVLLVPKFVVCQSSREPLPVLQAARSSLAGTVADPTGAVIPGATVRLHGGGTRKDVQTVTDGLGHYSFPSLGGGKYTVFVSREGFASFASKEVDLQTGRPGSLNVQLRIATEEQQMDVSAAEDTLDPNNNPDGLTLKSREIEQLPDDPDLLSRQLQAMAGSTTSQTYVDGYSGGSIPPKDMIREIRINQNPYSAKNDTDPIDGLIEIFTKPGTDKLHGGFSAFGNDSSLNARARFDPDQPPYHSYYFNGYLSGPLSKHASYFFNVNRQVSDSNQSIAAVVLTDLQPTTLTEALPTTNSYMNYNPRIDVQFSKSNTASFRYSYSGRKQNNGGIGQLNLPEQGYDMDSLTQVLQVSDTQNFGVKVVNDLRFSYQRTRASQNPYSTAPTLMVQGAFTGGGSPLGQYRDNQDRYELQNYVSYAAGKHFLNFGVRLRSLRDSNRSSQNFNGEYVFPSISAYQITLQGLQANLSPQAIRAAGGGASQFMLAAGTPSVAVTTTDVALFYEDDWRVKPTFTLSYGLRYEAQNYVSDKRDWAPRLGIAWKFGPKKSPFALTAGNGLFYHRLASGSILNAARQNGVTQQQYVLTLPDTYPSIPEPSQLTSLVSSSTYQINPRYRAQVVYVASTTVSHPLGKGGGFSLNSLVSRGFHGPLIRNINAPLPGTYDPNVPGSGVRPFGGTSNINQYDSDGYFQYFRFGPSLNYSNKVFNIYMNYWYVHYTVDASGGFPSNQYNIHVDKGPGNLDTHSRLFAGTGFNLPYKISLSAFLQANSASPFNIVLGQDLNGDSQFNDRPTFATDLSRPSVVRTPWGIFDSSPIAGQTTIPYNIGRGPALFDFYLSIGHSWNFGPEQKVTLPAGSKAAIPRRYTASLSANAENPFNHVNLASPNGTLGSPLFGQYLYAASPQRQINVQMQFRF